MNRPQSFVFQRITKYPKFFPTRVPTSKEKMMKCIILLISVSMVYASGYGNDFSTSNYYPYSGGYIGANPAAQYTNGYSGYGYGNSAGYGYGNSAGSANSGYGTTYGSSGYGPSVYNVILPHPYPVPVPIPTGTQTGSRFLILNAANQNSGLFGFGEQGIFGFVVLLVFLHYILKTFNLTHTNQG